MSETNIILDWQFNIEITGQLTKKKCRICKMPLLEVYSPKMFDEDGQPCSLDYCLSCKEFLH